MTPVPWRLPCAFAIPGAGTAKLMSACSVPPQLVLVGSPMAAVVPSPLSIAACIAAGVVTLASVCVSAALVAALPLKSRGNPWELQAALSLLVKLVLLQPYASLLPFGS